MKLANKFLLCAAVYGLCGMVMGTVMGIKENFILAPVHAHLNLLGFVAISIYGLAYKAFPEMQASRLAQIHFYIVNAGVILLIPSLTIFLLGNRDMIPLMSVGELLTIASMMVFIVNLWKHRNS